MDQIKQQLSAELKNALLRKDDVAVKTLRSLMSALDNAEAVAVENPKSLPVSGTFAGATAGLGSTEAVRKELAKKDILTIIQKEINELEETQKILSARSMDAKQYSEQINILKNIYEMVQKTT